MNVNIFGLTETILQKFEATRESEELEFTPPNGKEITGIPQA